MAHHSNLQETPQYHNSYNNIRLCAKSPLQSLILDMFHKSILNNIIATCVVLSNYATSNIYSVVSSKIKSSLKDLQLQIIISWYMVKYQWPRRMWCTQMWYLQELPSCHFRPSYFNNYWANMYQNYILYPLHIHDNNFDKNWLRVVYKI